ncbi:hypothetical protein KAR91_41995 [Candidatus Pacearchaeota archaeon]|nr:hypothetical protein [Candidatus Pacearchaeota archaeon]
MAKFIVNENFQFGGSLRRTGAILEVDDFAVVAEIAKGKKPKGEANAGNPLSGLLNHCSPVDEHTVALLDGKVKPKKDALTAQKEEFEKAKDKEIKRLKAEFDKLGKAYNPNWAIDKLQKELKKAKLETAN